MLHLNVTAITPRYYLVMKEILPVYNWKENPYGY